MFPRALVANHARASQREIFEVQALQVRADIRGGGAIGARLDRRGEALDRHGPPIRSGVAVEALDEILGDWFHAAEMTWQESGDRSQESGHRLIRDTVHPVS